MTREGADWSSPEQAIFGPKVMLINQMSGSGGDALPWYFRKAGIGPLIGKTTWGGLVGIGGYPELDRRRQRYGAATAFYGLNGEWEVENRGVAPDHEVDLEPRRIEKDAMRSSTRPSSWRSSGRGAAGAEVSAPCVPEVPQAQRIRAW